VFSRWHKDIPEEVKEAIKICPLRGHGQRRTRRAKGNSRPSLGLQLLDRKKGFPGQIPFLSVDPM
jgi:hypothetical protein